MSAVVRSILLTFREMHLRTVPGAVKEGGEALPPIPSRGFLAVGLERAQHTHTCVIKNRGKSTHGDARSV